ncbi:uncharacterized protein LOC135152109 isoform X1 [Daucus carota subsp. sativus]
MAKNSKAVDQGPDEEHAAEPQEDESLDETEDEQESGDDDSQKSLPALTLVPKPPEPKAPTSSKPSHTKHTVSKIHKKRSAERADKVSKKRKVDKGLRNKDRSIKKKDKKRVSEANGNASVVLDFWGLFPRLCASLETEAVGDLKEILVRNVKENVEGMIRRMGEAKARELEEGWKAVHEKEGKLYVERTRLIQMQAEDAAESLSRTLRRGGWVHE